MLTNLAKLLVFSVMLSPADAKVLNEERMLQCIAQLETGATNTSRAVRKIGRAGERSAWQITPAVWAKYSTAPFTRASSDARLGNVVAAAHLRWLRLELRGAGVRVDPFRLALAWNAGLSAAVNDKAPPGARDYAARAVALYEGLAKETR